MPPHSLTTTPHAGTAGQSLQNGLLYTNIYGGDNQSFTAAIGHANWGFINTASDTINVAVSGSHINAFQDANLSVIIAAGVNNVTLSLDRLSGITNIANLNATDHISLSDSGFANPAAAVAALTPTHFGQQLVLGSGAKIEFLHNTPLTVSSFTHVS